ncbi:hypothetical protein Tco_1490164, partial [Tanacetum coccineum]
GSDDGGDVRVPSMMMVVMLGSEYDDGGDGGAGSEYDYSGDVKVPSMMMVVMVALCSDDNGNDSGPTESEPVDPTKLGTVVDLNIAEEAAREALNEVVIPQIQPAQKRVVKPSSYVLSPYMNKKTNVVPKITKMEFIVGNSLFAMQGDKLFTLNLMRFTLKSHEIQSESHEIQSESHEISL